MFDIRRAIGDFFSSAFRTAVPTDAALVYFESVLSRYEGIRGMPDTRSDPTAADIIEELLTRYREHSISISMNDALLLERMMCRLLPPNRLPGTLLDTRAHYKRLVSPEEYQAYLEGHSVDPAHPPSGSQACAEIQDLLGLIQNIYVFAPFCERIRSRLSLRITLVLLVLTSVVLFFVWSAGGQKSLPILVVAMLVGGLSGLVSVHYRIQSKSPDGDAIRGALSLYDGWLSVSFSPVIGAVSAGLLYMLFRGDLISGTLFPNLSKVERVASGSSEPNDFNSLIGLSHNLEAIEYAKLVIWSFIAGFVERVVPDTLSRLSDALASQKFPSAGSQPGARAEGGGGIRQPQGDRARADGDGAPVEALEGGDGAGVEGHAEGGR